MPGRPAHRSPRRSAAERRSEQGRIGDERRRRAVVRPAELVNCASRARHHCAAAAPCRRSRAPGCPPSAGSRSVERSDTGANNSIDAATPGEHPDLVVRLHGPARRRTARCRPAAGRMVRGFRQGEALRPLRAPHAVVDIRQRRAEPRCRTGVVPGCAVDQLVGIAVDQQQVLQRVMVLHLVEGAMKGGIGVARGAGAGLEPGLLERLHGTRQRGQHAQRRDAVAKLLARDVHLRIATLDKQRLVPGRETGSRFRAAGLPQRAGGDQRAQQGGGCAAQQKSLAQVHQVSSAFSSSGERELGGPGIEQCGRIDQGMRPAAGIDRIAPHEFGQRRGQCRRRGTLAIPVDGLASAGRPRNTSPATSSPSPPMSR